MCDCDCELPKRAKWEQIKREHAHGLAEAVRDRTNPLTPGDCTCDPYCCSCKDTAAFIEAYGTET